MTGAVNNRRTKNMNANYDLTFTAHLLCGDFSKEMTFDPYNDATSMDALKEMAENDLNNDDEFKESGEEIGQLEVEIIEFDNIPEKYQNENDCWSFAEALAESECEIEIVEAALDCEVNPSDIDEAYAGSYKDDEDFAWEMATELGAIEKDAKWPNNCIDWTQAAKELMYDYSSSNGYYFRNL